MDFHCCLGAKWERWGRKNKTEFPSCNWRETRPLCFAEFRKCSKSQSSCSETNRFWGIPCDNSSHSFHSLHSPRWRGKGEMTTTQQVWWECIFCWRSSCILKAKGSATTVTVSISQGGVADNAESGSLPALLLPHSSAPRSLPFIGHSGRGLKVGLIVMVSADPGFPGHRGALCSPLTLTT